MQNEGVNLRKAAVIGCGFVGSASAFSLMNSGLFSELVLIDADHAKAEGEAMDISHGGFPHFGPKYPELKKYMQGKL